MLFRLVVCSFLWLLSLAARAQAPGGNSAASNNSNSKSLPTETPTPDPGIIIPQPSARTIPEKERSAACHKYEGHFISYYGEVFKVEKCLRRQLMSHISIASLAQRHEKIIPVDSQPIAALDEGLPLSDTVHSISKRNCKELGGRYVTFSFNEIFYVEKCKKRLFPDWASYLNHRTKANAKQSEILGLTWEEFDAIDSGQDFPSSMDQEFAKMREQDKPLAMVPIKEACKGLEGKYMSFHSKMYLIENCKKREIDPEKLTRLRGRQGLRVAELKSEYWLSLPDGKPVP